MDKLEVTCWYYLSFLEELSVSMWVNKGLKRTLVVDQLPASERPLRSLHLFQQFFFVNVSLFATVLKAVCTKCDFYLVTLII